MLISGQCLLFSYWKLECPDGMVEDLNSYLDDLRKQDDKESLANSLVGQIAHGEQLNMDPEHEMVKAVF